MTEHGRVPIKAPRDRDGGFGPQIVRKGQRRFEGFDDKILALSSRGLSTRDIEAHLREIYGVKAGRDLISRVTDAVMDDVRAWQQRPLDDVYPVIFLDCLVLKVREGGSVQRRGYYLALGVTVEGDRDVLGLWFQQTEGAKFWMQVLTELKQRGVSDILICCVDALKGVPPGQSRPSSPRPWCRRASCTSSATGAGRAGAPCSHRVPVPEATARPDCGRGGTVVFSVLDAAGGVARRQPCEGGVIAKPA